MVSSPDDWKKATRVYDLLSALMSKLADKLTRQLSMCLVIEHLEQTPV